MPAVDDYRNTLVHWAALCTSASMNIYVQYSTVWSIIIANV